MATSQNKSQFFWSAAEIFVQQNVHMTTTAIMKTLFFLKNDHNISKMF